MARQQGWFALVLALAIAAGALLFSSPLQLGLDLRGGSQITVEVQPAGEITRVTATEMEAVKAVLDRRVNGLGVAESTLQTVGNDQLVLQLPGEQDPTRAARVLGSTALLEFRSTKPGVEEDLRSLRQLRSQARAILRLRQEQEKRGESVEGSGLDLEQLNEAQKLFGLEGSAGSETEQLEQLLAKVNEAIVELFGPAELTGKDLVSAGRQPLQNNPNSWEVTLSFNSDGAEAFAELTKSIAGTDRLLAIVLDGRSISEASVGSQFKTAGITGGSASISGNFTAEEARELEVQLRGGSLPLPVEVLEVRTIGPTLGAENIRRSLVAALSGLALVAVFMVFAYRLPGVVAVLALSLYALFNLAIYALIPVTLTLPGIAGFILSIGMAVDANVLIFERIKEELKNEKNNLVAFDSGYTKSRTAILDANITTLLAAIILFFMGSGPIKGFSLTLGVGIFTTLFSVYFIARLLTVLYVSKNKEKEGLI